MINNEIFKLMQSFPRSFVNQYGEFIAHEDANEYFKLSNCVDDLEIKCKVLECLSRAACKTEPFRDKNKNEKFNSFMLGGINKFLNTNFDKNEMRMIYQELGNRVNRELTTKFIKSCYNLKILLESEEE